MLEPVAMADGDLPPAGDSLRDRIVLVTGATGGLGRATSIAAASAGATVVLSGRKVRALESLYDEIERVGGPQPAVYPIDLCGASPRDYADLAASVEREFGRLHGIVHAAAHFDGLQPFDQQKPEEWLRAQQVNVTAPFLMTQACLPLMRASGDTAIVFVLDDPVRMGKAFWGGYGASKQALAGFASIVHEETENSSVRTHALLPGPMRTVLRRAAYYGENTLKHPEPDYAARFVVWLLGAGGAGMRGKTVDLRSDPT